LTAYGCSEWEPEFIKDEFEEEHQVDGDTYLRYNFTNKNPRWGLGYTDPEKVTALTHKIISEIGALKQYE
jgi:hypothetical protein